MDSLEAYFSKLLINACVVDDTTGAAELLHSIMSAANVEAATTFPPSGVLLNNAFDGFRPIHRATLFGHGEIVQMLLQRHWRSCCETALSGLVAFLVTHQCLNSHATLLLHT
jgi:hypothetical protein